MRRPGMTSATSGPESGRTCGGGEWRRASVAFLPKLGNDPVGQNAVIFGPLVGSQSFYCLLELSLVVPGASPN